MTIEVPIHNVRTNLRVSAGLLALLFCACQDSRSEALDGISDLDAMAGTGQSDPAIGEDDDDDDDDDDGRPTETGGVDDDDDGAVDGSGMCSPRPTAFPHTLCICEDLIDVGALRVRRESLDEASVGVNGRTAMAGDIDIEGSATLYAGVRAPVRLQLDGNLATAGSADILGVAEIAGDFDVGENLLGIGYLDLGGELRVAGRQLLLGLSNQAGLAEYVEPELPCGCDESELLDIAGLVDDARTDNDNEVIALPTNVLQLGVAEWRLPEGRYYLEDVDSLGATRFVIEGPVSLYIDGSLDVIGVGLFDLAPGATLDLYVSGNVRTVGRVRFGEVEDASDFRLYVGGDESVEIAVGDQDFNASIYAPRATLAYIGNTEIVGAVFARELVGLGRLVIGGGFSSEDCEPDDPDSDDPDSDDGGEPDPGDGGEPNPGDGGEPDPGELPVP